MCFIIVFAMTTVASASTKKIDDIGKCSQHLNTSKFKRQNKLQGTCTHIWFWYKAELDLD